MSTNKKHTNANDRILLAVCCSLGAHMMFAIMGACAKLLSEKHHVIEIAFLRNIIVLVPFFLFLIISKKQHFLMTKRPKTVAFRAVIGGVSLILTFGAQSLLPMANATVIFFTSTLLTPVFAFFILKEHIGVHRWAAVFFGMCGVLIIAMPSANISTIGMLLALGAAILHATMYITLRNLKTESPVTVTFYFVLAGAIIPGLAMPWLAKGISSNEIGFFLLLGLSGGLAQLLVSCAYKYAPASFVTPFAYSSLLWSTSLDYIIWSTPPSKYVFWGASLIIAAQIYILYREKVNRQKTSHIINSELQ